MCQKLARKLHDETFAFENEKKTWIFYDAKVEKEQQFPTLNEKANNKTIIKIDMKGEWKALLGQTKTEG